MKPGRSACSQKDGPSGRYDAVHERNPVTRQECASWVEREGDRFLGTRVFPKALSPTLSRRTIVRIAAAAAAICVLSGIGLILVLAADSPGQRVATGISTTTSSPIVETEPVLVGEALPRVVQLAESTRVAYVPELPGTHEEGLIERATSLGLVSSLEASDYSPNDRVARGQFALWLWRGFGHLFPATDSAANDIAMLSDEEKAAIAFVTANGVIDAYEDGAFGSAGLLTARDLDAAIDALLGLLARETPTDAT
jgi:hypothetical protein